MGRQAGRPKTYYLRVRSGPHKQPRYCHAESDYSVEIGELIVSGVSCLLKESDFRRRTCYNMFHGGLMCSDTLKYPQEAVAAAGVKPSAFAFPAVEA